MAEGTSSAVETPSGKEAAYENFPVGSFLIRPRLRPHVMAFYAYARAIDDIADNPDLPAKEKLRRLDGFDRAITGSLTDDPGYAKGYAMRHSLSVTGVTDRHCRDLIDAFKQDAVKTRYGTWDELIDYCQRSAAPVGRYLIDLHGGCRGDYAPSDALCNALQILNHLQDCQEDYRLLDRVYLPLDWLNGAGVRVEDLDGRRTGPGLRRVLDRCLAGVDGLLHRAEGLPRTLNDRRLAMETAAILEIARMLRVRLRRGDPLRRRIALGTADYLLCCSRGAALGLFRA